MSAESTSEVLLKFKTADISAKSPSQPKNSRQLALEDFYQGIEKWHIWLSLAYQDIKLRYRRSALGPFWITLSMAITIYSMGFLYGHLFRTDLREYFPFLAAGLLSWTLISTTISDLTDAFIASEGLIKQIKLPYSIYIHRVIMRNFIIFFHNILVMIPIFIIFHSSLSINFKSLLLIPNLALIYFNAVTYGLILAMIGARYRDIPQIIKSLIQVIFFITPVIWNPAILPEKYHVLVVYNPFYAFVQLIREPLTGNSPSLSVFTMMGVVSLIGILFSWALFVKYRARIVYWL